MVRTTCCLFVAAVLMILNMATVRGQEGTKDAAKRMVLVELFTSQGCDMCPTAEQILGGIADKDRSIVPIAFHVDYFNEPWRDVFSDALYSERQSAYNQIYTGPKDPNYGLYYTPMMMVDGITTVNGRDPAGAAVAIRKAMGRKPGVAIGVTLEVPEDGPVGKVEIKVSSLSAKAERVPLLVCAVLREDGVVTRVRSGENAGKSLVARFPARRTEYGFIELAGKGASSTRFSFGVEPGWNARRLRLAVFVQDKRTGEVHQAVDLPWRTTGVVRQGATGNTLKGG